jgi:hypothetical protein
MGGSFFGNRLHGIGNMVAGNGIQPGIKVGNVYQRMAVYPYLQKNILNNIISY